MKLEARRQKYARRSEGEDARRRSPSPVPQPAGKAAIFEIRESPEPVRTATTPKKHEVERVLQVDIQRPPMLPVAVRKPETLEDRLAAVCTRYHTQPYNFSSVWTDARINVIIVQMTDTYGAHTALFRWIEQLAPGRAAKPFDLAGMHVNLPRFLANVWIAQDDQGRGLVPVIVATTDEMLGWLCDVLSKLPPREQAKTYQRVVVVMDDAYGEGANLTKLRRLDPVRVCKVAALSEECLRRCLQLVVADLNASSVAHNERNPSGPKRTILKLSEAQTRSVISQSAGDPRWFVHALGYRVLAAGKMNLRALATDDTGMNDAQIATRLMVGSMWSHVVAIELEEADVAAVSAAVSAERGMALELGSRAMAAQGHAKIKAKIMAPGCCRSHVVKVLRPFSLSMRIDPILDGANVTDTVKTMISVNYAHAVEQRMHEAQMRDRVATLERMAMVADDLALCDELETPYAHRERLRVYTADVHALTVPARSGSRRFQGYSADQTQQLEACTRKNSARFYEHLGSVKKRNSRQRSLREYVAKRSDVAAIDVGTRARVGGFWDQHIPVQEIAPHHFARDAGLYAAVAFHIDPPSPGSLEAVASWANHQDSPPRDVCARTLAEWFSKRCRYPHFYSTAWTLAWSSLAEGLVGVSRPSRLLVAIGAMLRAGMERAPVVTEVEGARMSKKWAQGRFPPALGRDGDVMPDPRLVAEVIRIWSMAQSVLAL